MENRHSQMKLPKSARLFSLEFWHIVVGIKTWREVNEDDFEENRENLGPVQSSDRVATDVSGVITLILQVVILLKLFNVI